ncbi:MAG: Mov34/MPN/PAD-1 family protein [Candidatus Hodarchaeales archaeon]
MLYSYPEESIYIQIDQKTYDEMVDEGSLWPRIETGGMLFGRIIKDENRLLIEILKTYIPSDNNCIREAAYFEIDPAYAKSIVSQENLQYLGNWHKHPGYGGPSAGDRHQIQEFFVNNPHLDAILTFILNFLSEDDYEPIIEVYFRGESTIEGNPSFLTHHIPQSNLSYTTNETAVEKPVMIERGVPSRVLTQIKTELVHLFDNLSSTDDIQVYPGQTPDEKVLSFPYQFRISHLDQLETITLLVLLSFPPEFPEGKIYLDISSEDMSKDITFKTHPAETLNDAELVQPFLLLLKSDLEDDIPKLLKRPLWQVMQELL